MRKIVACIALTIVSTSTTAEVNEVVVTSDANYRYINSNGIPKSHGKFPNAKNPYAIRAQNYNFIMPLNPKLADKPVPLLEYTSFGVGINGIPFDPDSYSEWNNNPNWYYEVVMQRNQLGLDFNTAHVLANGAYHYHGLPLELLIDQNNKTHSKIIGYAADGFPIYARFGYGNQDDPNSGIKELFPSYKLRTGKRPDSAPSGDYDGTFTQDYEYIEGSGDLDECNGRFGITPDFPQGTYYYYITDDFPYIPRCFKGTPDKSFYKVIYNSEKPNNTYVPPPPTSPRFSR